MVQLETVIETPAIYIARCLHRWEPGPCHVEVIEGEPVAVQTRVCAYCGEVKRFVETDRDVFEA